MKMRVMPAFAVVLAVAAGMLLAQGPAFEVASIRPASPPTFEAMQKGQVHIGAKIDGAHLDFGFIALWDLLPYSFRVKQYQMVSPAWTHDSHWNILANLPAGSTKEQVPEMMQALLAERFKLTTHREKREQQVYELVVAAGGPKVEVADGGPVKLWDGSFPGFNFSGPLGGDAVISGRILDQPNCNIRWEFVPLPMSRFADALTMFLDKPVVDKTGLKGDYKVALDINADTMTAMDQNMARGRGMAPPPPPGEDSGRGGGGKQGPPAGAPPGPAQGMMQCLQAAAGSDGSIGMLFKAVQKLGLDLKQTRAQIDTIVVDRLEKTPTEN